MNTPLIQQITFYALYAAIAIITFVVIERAIFFLINAYQAACLLRAHETGVSYAGAVGVAAEACAAAQKVAQARLPWEQSKNQTDAIFIATRWRLQRNLWLLDTIVATAPLLGLLGTVVGIVHTFTALAEGSISDPAGVSAAFGTALFGTALGIGVALYGLLFLHLFRERVERVSDIIKILLLNSPSPLHSGET